MALFEAKLSGALALVLGAEGKDCEAYARDLRRINRDSDAGQVESLNVSVRRHLPLRSQAAASCRSKAVNP